MVVGHRDSMLQNQQCIALGAYSGEDCPLIRLKVAT